MARRRFFVETIQDGAAQLRGEDARHLGRVLRAEAGQLYEISDNRSVYLARIEAAKGDTVLFRTVEELPARPAAVRIDLFCAIIKFDRFEWMVEKATELGVNRIVPVEAARTEKGLFQAAEKRRERWIRIAREASQQSRRDHLPEVAAAVRFADALRTETAHRYFLEEEEAPPILSALPAARAAADRVALLAGPEGGWTGAERSQAAEAGWRPVSLGANVLRAETAAAAALAVVSAAWWLPG